MENKFAKNIRTISKKKKIPLSYIAEKCGTTRQSFDSILRNNNPQANLLLRISEFLEITIDDLLKKDL